MISLVTPAQLETEEFLTAYKNSIIGSATKGAGTEEAAEENETDRNQTVMCYQ